MLVEVVRALLEGEEAVQVRGLAVVGRRVETAPVCVALRYTPPSKLSIMHEIDVEMLLSMFGMHDRDFTILRELLWIL